MTILLPAWWAILTNLKLPQQNIPHDVQTQWNSAYDMLSFVLKYRVAVESMTQRWDLGLHRYDLDANEWQLAQQLKDVLMVRCCHPRWMLAYLTSCLPVTPLSSLLCLCILTDILQQTLKEATLFFSCSTPNLATMIPAMDHIDNVLASFTWDMEYNEAIREGISLARNTLNWYYSLTDSSEVYWISMSKYIEPFEVIYWQNAVLHPWHKLAYFRNAGWTTDWIQVAEDLIHEEYECYMAIEVLGEEAPDTGSAEAGVDDQVSHQLVPLIWYTDEAHPAKREHFWSIIRSCTTQASWSVVWSRPLSNQWCGECGGCPIVVAREARYLSSAISQYQVSLVFYIYM